jgi:hypothetical protein
MMIFKTKTESVIRKNSKWMQDLAFHELQLNGGNLFEFYSKSSSLLIVEALVETANNRIYRMLSPITLKFKLPY